MRLIDRTQEKWAFLPRKSLENAQFQFKRNTIFIEIRFKYFISPTMQLVSQSPTGPREESVMTSGNRKCVLIVDRDQAMLDMLTETLHLHGLVVLSAHSIREALAYVESQEVDAIVSDFRLQDGTGLEFIRILKRCGVEIPSGLMLSRDPDLSELSALAEGADLVFQKPFGLADFFEGVKILLEQTREKINPPGLRTELDPESLSVGKSSRL
jgi:CheY-like chemotaxis protein